MMAGRPLAFDSHVLTYFLDGNDGNYSKATDSLADERVAAVRLFFHCRPFIAPIVRVEALDIPDPIKREKHIRSIDGSFEEIVPDDQQIVNIGRRPSFSSITPRG
jgi:hypothetical protein